MLALRLDDQVISQRVIDKELAARRQDRAGELLRFMVRPPALRPSFPILATFMDLGFGVDSVQMLLPALAEASSEDEADQLDEGLSTEG